MCNFFNEGCRGGWPLLNGYFLEDFYLPLESCAPYKAHTVGDQCSNYKHCPMAVKIKKSFYIGEYYGGNSEAAMMKEIRSRGPIVSDLNVPLGFSFYKSGIFSDVHAKALKELSDPEFVHSLTDSTGINNYTIRDYHI